MEIEDNLPESKDQTRVPITDIYLFQELKIDPCKGFVNIDV